MRQLDDGTEIIREGKTGTSLFILIHGEVDVETSVRGESVHLARLPRKRFLRRDRLPHGEVPRTATIRSIGAVEVLELDRDALTSLINRYPIIAQRLRARLHRRAEHTVEVVRRTLRTQLTALPLAPLRRDPEFVDDLSGGIAQDGRLPFQIPRRRRVSPVEVRCPPA